MRKSASDSKKTNKQPPALSPEGRLNQLISLAFDLLETRLNDGTATSQEVTTLIKYGTKKSKLENQKLESEIELAGAKASNLKSAEDIEALYKEAMVAFSGYQGKDDFEDEEELY